MSVAGADFLHPTLAADCHDLGDLSKSRLLLNRNASLHWFILVPRTSTLDLLDLPDEDLDLLMRAAQRVAGVLKTRLDYPRVNVGALGLLVPQLHLHVVGRREEDPCWPAPVWGNLAPGPQYTAASLQALRSELDIA